MRFLETFLSENSGATLSARFPPPKIFPAGTKAPSPWAAPENPQMSRVAAHTPHSHVDTSVPIPVPPWILKAV